MENIRVSAQAFLQQIESWNTTLHRQTQKLISLKCTVKNKFKLNSIDIVLTEIQSLQIKYKKIKKKYHPLVSNENIIPNLQNQNQKSLSDSLLNEYSDLSKIFMQILEKVSLIEGESDEPNFLIQKFQEGEQNRKKTQSMLKKVDKTFSNDTFAFKAGKQKKDRSNKSIFEKRKANEQKQGGYDGRVKTHSVLTKISDISNISVKNQPGNKKHKQIGKHFQSQVNQSSENLWQIRHQLQTITQMMKEMKSQIKFHEHQETNREINKIQTKNRKMASQLKSIKQGNRLILDKLQELKKQLTEEKRSQVDMINKFEKRSGNSKYNLYDSIATHADNYISVEGEKQSQTNRKSEHLENVSDWVKMRI